MEQHKQARRRTMFEEMTLEAIISELGGICFQQRRAGMESLLLLNCLSPKGGGEPKARWRVPSMISSAHSKIQEAFSDAAVSFFRLRWIWLVKDETAIGILKRRAKATHR